MSQREWELILHDGFGTKAEAVMDDATELASMIADDFYPPVLSDEVRYESAAALVLWLWQDADASRCVREIERTLFGAASGTGEDAP